MRFDRGIEGWRFGAIKEQSSYISMENANPECGKLRYPTLCEMDLDENWYCYSQFLPSYYGPWHNISTIISSKWLARILRRRNPRKRGFSSEGGPHRKDESQRDGFPHLNITS